MDHQDLDRILNETPRIEPGPDFAASVMADVHVEAEAPTVAFPWHLAWVAVAGVVVVAAALAFVDLRPVIHEDRTGSTTGAAAVVALVVTLAVCAETIRRVLGAWTKA